jgi:hypothetical protein
MDNLFNRLFGSNKDPKKDQNQNSNDDSNAEEALKKGEDALDALEKLLERMAAAKGGKPSSEAEAQRKAQSLLEDMESYAQRTHGEYDTFQRISDSYERNARKRWREIGKDPDEITGPPPEWIAFKSAQLIEDADELHKIMIISEEPCFLATLSPLLKVILSGDAGFVKIGKGLTPEGKQKLPKIEVEKIGENMLRTFQEDFNKMEINLYGNLLRVLNSLDKEDVREDYWDAIVAQRTLYAKRMEQLLEV